MEGERPFPDRRLDRRDQGPGPLRGEDAAGVLDHDRVDVGALDELSRLRCVERVGVDRALAEDEPTDGVRAEGFRVQEPLGEIVEVVQAVERDEAIDAARHQPLDPESMDIERLKLEAERAAASRDDLERPPHVLAE